MIKKQFKDTKFYSFLDKAKGYVPELITVATQGIQGNYVGAIATTRDIISKAKTEKKEELLQELEEKKEEFNHELESFKLEVDDRKDARKLYSLDSLAQKILAAIFTLSYFAITFVLISHFFKDGDKLEDYELGFMSTLFGAMSSKVNTIIDFFFGGSLKK